MKHFEDRNPVSSNGLLNQSQLKSQSGCRTMEWSKRRKGGERRGGGRRLRVKDATRHVVKVVWKISLASQTQWLSDKIRHLTRKHIFYASTITDRYDAAVANS